MDVAPKKYLLYIGLFKIKRYLIKLVQNCGFIVPTIYYKKTQSFYYLLSTNDQCLMHDG